MTKIPNVKSPPHYQFGQDYCQRGHHSRNIDNYSYAPYPESEHSYSVQNLEKINIPACDSSELSIEEIRRDFSPPRAEPYQRSWYSLNFQPPTMSNMDCSPHNHHVNEKDSRQSDKKFKNYHNRKSSTSFKTSELEDRSLSQNQILLATIGGAALATGGKELWDRSKPRGSNRSNPVHMIAIGAAGALAGYQGAEIYSKFVKQEGKLQKKYYSGDRRRKNYSSSQDDNKSRRSKSRHRYSSNESIDLSSTDSNYYDQTYAAKGRNHDNLNTTTRLQQLAKAALIAGATEALRIRKEPGTWSGNKGKNVLTAAIGASAVDAVAEENGKHHILETIMRGLTSNRLINGPRHQVNNRSDRRKNRNRSRSRNSNKDITSSIATIITAGVGALAGKELIGRSRSRSRATRSQRRQRSPSLSSSGSSIGQNYHGLIHQRSKSIIEIAQKGLSALGFGELNEYESNRTNKSRQRSYRFDSDTDSSQVSSNDHYSVDREGRKIYRHVSKITRDGNLKSKRGGNSHKSSYGNSSRIKNKDKKNSNDSDSYYSSRSSTENEKYRAGTRGTNGKREG